MGLWFVDELGVQSAARCIMWRFRQYARCRDWTQDETMFECFLALVEDSFDSMTRRRVRLWTDCVFTRADLEDGDPLGRWHWALRGLRDGPDLKGLMHGPGWKLLEWLLAEYEEWDARDHSWARLCGSREVSTHWDHWIVENTHFTTDHKLIGHEDYGDLQDGVWQTVEYWQFLLWWERTRREVSRSQLSSLISEIGRVPFVLASEGGLSEDAIVGDLLPDILNPALA